VLVQASAGFGLTASRIACGARVLALLNRSAMAVSREGDGIVSVHASIKSPPTGCVAGTPAGARVNTDSRPDGGRFDALVNDVAIQRSPSVHGDCAISRLVEPLSPAISRRNSRSDSAVAFGRVRPLASSQVRGASGFPSSGFSVALTMP